MSFYQANSFNEMYPELINSVVDAPERHTRWASSREELQASAYILDPSNPVVTASGRPVNLAFALAEVVWILAGRSDAGFISPFNDNITQFADDGRTFNAAYGERLRRAHGHDQIIDVIQLLQADPMTRQAVMNIWFPELDCYQRGETKDRACNTQSILILRDGKLNWTQIQRSNDLIWGTPYNWIQFAHLQAYMAGVLGVEVGTYVHFISSLHIYEDYWQEAEDIRAFDLDKHLPAPSINFEGFTPDTRLVGLTELVRFIGTSESIEWRDLRGAPNRYWSSALAVMAAYRLYKMNRDVEAIHMLSNALPFHFAVQARFMYHHRWSKPKNIDGLVKVAEAMNEHTSMMNPAVTSFIRGEL